MSTLDSATDLATGYAVIRRLYDVATDGEAAVLDRLLAKASHVRQCPDDGWNLVPDEVCGVCGLTWDNAPANSQ